MIRLFAPPPHIPSRYRPDIDGLRAFAVLAVIAYHFFPSWVKGGFVGVDIFFVIIGTRISIFRSESELKICALESNCARLYRHLRELIYSRRGFSSSACGGNGSPPLQPVHPACPCQRGTDWKAIYDLERSFMVQQAHYKHGEEKSLHE